MRLARAVRRAEAVLKKLEAKEGAARKLDELPLFASIAEAPAEAVDPSEAERILAETDSPYLAPQARRGRPNEPANVALTVQELAKTRRVDPDELGAQIAANAAAAFSLP